MVGYHARKPWCRRETARCRCNFPRWRLAALLDLIEPEIVPFDSPTPKSVHTTKHKVGRMTRCGDMAIQNIAICRHITRDASGIPILTEGEIVGGHFTHRSYHWKERWYFFISSSLRYDTIEEFNVDIVTIALSLTIPAKFAMEYLQRSLQQKGGSPFWVKILGFSLWSRSVMLGSADSEHPRVTI